MQECLEQGPALMFLQYYSLGQAKSFLITTHIKTLLPQLSLLSFWSAMPSYLHMILKLFLL